MTHFREVDVQRVTMAGHPNLLTLNGRPKNEGSAPDMLGKDPAMSISDSMRSPSGSRWKGHDPHHLSINYLASFALLTGDRFARQEMEHHCMLYLSGFTFKRGSFNDAPGASRQVGRSSLAAIWMWLVTGREDVKIRAVNRVRDLAERMASQNLPIKVIKPRQYDQAWYVWEEANGVTGLAAIHRHFQTPEALSIVHQVSRSVVVHGYAQLKTGEWRVGYHLPFEDSAGRVYVARTDPLFDTRAAGRGLTTWGAPAVFLAADSHPDGAVRALALEIVRELYGGHPISGLDTCLEWVGVSSNVTSLGHMTSAY